MMLAAHKNTAVMNEAEVLNYWNKQLMLDPYATVSTDAGNGFIVQTDDGIEYIECLTFGLSAIYRRSTKMEDLLYALWQKEILKNQRHKKHLAPTLKVEVKENPSTDEIPCA